MQFKFPEAMRHFKEEKKKAREKASPDTGPKIEAKDIDPVIYKYFFDHQGKVEKVGEKKKTGMNYNVYAERMWEELVGDINGDNQNLFEQFKNSLILSLHNIDMSILVYPHVAESMVALVKKYQNKIKHIALWSTGDVEATGYQVGKINSSKIISAYHKALKKVLPEKGEAQRIMQEETSYMVADRKFESFIEYIQQALEKNGGNELKVVMIEDSRKNFDKAVSVMTEVLGEKIKQVKFIPIWAMYSREGQQAEKSGESGLESRVADLNAIRSFDDLLDDRFSNILEGAHLFVDFDGVIGDNVVMRDEQAKATYRALLGPALSSTGLDEKELVARIKSRITNLGK